MSSMACASTAKRTNRVWPRRRASPTIAAICSWASWSSLPTRKRSSRPRLINGRRITSQGGLVNDRTEGALSKGAGEVERPHLKNGGNGREEHFQFGRGAQEVGCQNGRSGH